MPEVIEAVAPDMETLCRVANPMAIPSGVITEYKTAPTSGAHAHEGGSCRNASRVPRPRPSNISARSGTPGGGLTMEDDHDEQGRKLVRR